MDNLVLRLPLDTTKRHLIIGDIHGRYESFLNLLASAEYNPLTDVLYSVGDMIDRGPKSYEVLHFFNTMDNVYTIKGNHEFMVEHPIEWKDVWLRNGGVQCLRSLAMNGVDESWLTTYISFLPWIIEVGEDNEEHAFRVMHADLPPEWSDRDLRSVVDGATSVTDNGLQHILWSRRTITNALRAGAEMKPHGMQFHPNRNRKTFLGHTPTRKVVRVGDMTFLDTYGSRTLSMVEAVSGESWTVDVVD